MTSTDQERTAYLAGNTQLADALARIADLEWEVEQLEEKISDTTTLEQWETVNGPAQDYHDFFHACFERLADHYPCPSVTSGYDCSIIFDAIDKGEGVTE